MDDMIVGKPSCEAMADILPEPFVVIDRDYRVVATNTAYRRHHRVNRDSVVGRLCYEVSHRSAVPCSQNGEHCPLEEVLRTGESVQVIHVHFSAGGEQERVQLEAIPIRDDSGHIRFVGEYIHPLVDPQSEQNLLVGRSQAQAQLMDLLQRVAPTRTTVLLLGESGVGKERAAEFIHRFSSRAGGPFVVVDCGTLGETLIESELFGHEKGAFTGAVQRKLGLFEAANGGTLFIDELCELPLPLQTKLLRVLESGTIRRIGGTEYIPVDVRVVAATNREIQGMVERGEFRGDLYYRLSAFPVNIPALRTRREDIPALATQFLKELGQEECHLPLSPAVIEALVEHDYPGNVRELRNIIERAAILAGTARIEPRHLVFESCAAPSAQGVTKVSSTQDPLACSRPVRLTHETVVDALRTCNGHRGRAASYLGISERTLYRHLKRIRGNQAAASAAESGGLD